MMCILSAENADGLVRYTKAGGEIVLARLKTAYLLLSPLYLPWEFGLCHVPPVQGALLGHMDESSVLRLARTGKRAMAPR